MQSKPISLKAKCMMILKKMFFLTIGAFIAAAAIEGFLAPNNIIDGGVIGISMIASYLTKINLGLLVVLINFPFICLAFTKMGKKFVLQTFYAVIVFSLALNVFHEHVATSDLLLATVFGGIILGTGVGIILKNDGSLDGTEILSLVLSKKWGLSVGEFIMGLNIFIYCGAGLVFGWGKAMYSMLTYFIAYKVIDIVMEGLNSSKSVRIISDKSYEIGQTLIERLDIGITYIYGQGGYSRVDKTIIYCIISRLEMSKMKEIIREIDPNAFISVVDVHEAYGARLKKRAEKI
ncbi:MAG: YitT family protein [Cyanobacteria bacterium SIG32]|nr:YitT family protein [Cyanobacteria bacterium SIG32]